MLSFYDRLTLMSHEELVTLAREGNKAAFAELVQQHEREVYRFLCMMVSNSEDALDCTQEVFVKVWRKIGSLETPASFTPWLYTIARRQALDYWRGRKVYCSSLEDVGEDMLTDYVCNPEELVIENELVRKTLAALPMKLRECLLLQLVFGLSHQEIARMVGMRASSVSTYVCAAKKRFTQIYQHLSSERTQPLEEIDDA